MKIGIDKFLNIFYSIMNNDEIEAVDITDIVETIKIIYSSSEFQMISSRLDINEFSEDNIINNKYTIDFDDNGIVSFEVPESERAEIISKNQIDAGYIQQAINKCAMAKLLNISTKGVAQLKYDNPNGVYNMPKANLPEYKAESKLFTDGIITNNTFYKSTENDSCTRTIKLDNATFSLFVYYIDSIVDKIEVRGTYYGDYTLLLEETKRLLNFIDVSYDEVINVSPKVYKYKKH